MPLLELVPGLQIMRGAGMFGQKLIPDQGMGQLEAEELES